MIRVIKRYESRKLYDTEESRYVSLEDIAKWVRDGQEIKVIDNATSEEVTNQILTQVILDEGKRGTSFLPTDLLHELVRAGEKAFHSGVEQVQQKVDSIVQRSIDRLGPVRQAREEMSILRQRLAELEKTLISLEQEGVAAEPKAGSTTAPKKKTPKKKAAPKAARKPARRSAKAGKTTAAKGKKKAAATAVSAAAESAANEE
ncbi:MAG: hypothetical protein D6696_19765 [Acidobacteria bacterium]|nr:MAG: hypothetical protein D6696_19765 [Acidobacteriota bacterium]